MANIEGPKPMKAVASIAIYAAPVWAKVMEKRTYITGMEAA